MLAWSPPAGVARAARAPRAAGAPRAASPRAGALWRGLWGPPPRVWPTWPGFPGRISRRAPLWRAVAPSPRPRLGSPLARRPRRLRRALAAAREASAEEEQEAAAEAASPGHAEPWPAEASVAELLRFALPALGISLCGPVLSNIDNAFVGRFAGAEALAALSPGTIVADNILYLFVFLPRATVGLVSRANAGGGGPAAAQRELVRVLSVALPLGVALSLFYLACTPWLLGVLRVPPALRAQAAAYARVRGLVTWAALTQSVCLSAVLATKDSLTPLKVVVVAAVANLAGDFLFCAWPLRSGVVGAAGSTSIATLLGCALMLRTLWRRGLLFRGPLPLPSSFDDLRPLLEYAGPLMIVVLCRCAGLIAMGLTAASLGTKTLAAYQVLVNLLMLFGLFGEPLSQTAQAALPPLLQHGDRALARRAFRSLLALGAGAGVAAGVAAACVAFWGGELFTADPAVAAAVRSGAPVLLLCVLSLVWAFPVDGAMVATKDFSYLIAFSVAGVVVQLPLLALLPAYATGPRGLRLLLGTLALRLAALSCCALPRVLRRGGKLDPAHAVHAGPAAASGAGDTGGAGGAGGAA